MDASQKPPKDQKKKQQKQKQLQKKQSQQQSQSQSQQPQQPQQRQLAVKDRQSVNYINCKLLPKWYPLGQYKMNTKTAKITIGDQVSNEQLDIVKGELKNIKLLKENVTLPFSKIYENGLNYIKKDKRLFYGITLDKGNTVRCLWDFDYFINREEKEKNKLFPMDNGTGIITFWVYGQNDEDIKLFIDKIKEFKQYQEIYDLTEDEKDDKFNVDWIKYRNPALDAFRIYFMKGKIVIEAISNDYLQEAIGYVEKERRLYSERF